jgi:hypothetical protein
MTTQSRLSVGQPPRSGEQYPFLHGGEVLAPVIVDIAVQHDTSATLPLRIVSALNLQAAAASGNTIRLIIRDADNATVFDTLSAVYRGYHAWGDHYHTHTWEIGNRLLRVSLGTANQDDIPSVLNDLQAVIDPRTYVPALTGITAISFHNHRGPALATVTPGQGDIRLRAGNNVVYTVTQPTERDYDGSRLTSVVELSAIPGRGIGRYDNCGNQASPYIRSLNQQGPQNTGNFLLSGDTCFRIEPVVTFDEEGVATIAHGAINLFDDCEACCDCEDYLRPYFAIQRAKRLAEPLAVKLNELRDRYVVAKDAIEDALECMYGQMLRLEVINGQECQITISAGILNSSARELRNQQTEIRIFRDDGFGGWVPATLEYVPPIAAITVQGRPVRFLDLTTEPDSVIRFTMNCVPVGELHSAYFSVSMFGSYRVKVCYGIIGDDAENYVCREVDTRCTYTRTEYAT